jgi:hypothetical protein
LPALPGFLYGAYAHPTCGKPRIRFARRVLVLVLNFSSVQGMARRARHRATTHPGVVFSPCEQQQNGKWTHRRARSKPTQLKPTQTKPNQTKPNPIKSACKEPTLRRCPMKLEPERGDVKSLQMVCAMTVFRCLECRGGWGSVGQTPGNAGSTFFKPKNIWEFKLTGQSFLRPRPPPTPTPFVKRLIN